MGYTFVFYKDKKGEWRWRLVAANKNIIATSGEGYKNRGDCLDIIETIKQNARYAIVEEKK